MRVLFVASLHHPDPRALPARFVAAPEDPLFPDTQAHHFWVKALRSLGHDCAVFWRAMGAGVLQSRRSLRMGQRLTPVRALHALTAAVPEVNPVGRRRNRALVDAVSRFQPDVLILVGGNDVILPSTLAGIRARHRVRVVFASGTSPVVFSHRIERDAAPLYDLVLVNDRFHGEQWRELGSRRVEVLPLSAIDPDVHRPRSSEGDTGRIVFVGTLVPDRLYGERVAALEALAGLPLDIWSVHDVPSSLRACYRGPALGQAMIERLRQAAIVVNPHGDFMRDGGNMRLFEACGVGVLQVADARPALTQWFTPGTHLLTYESPAALVDLVRTYLADSAARRAIARAGCAHVHAHHTYTHRMRRLVALLDAVGPS